MVSSDYLSIGLLYNVWKQARVRCAAEQNTHNRWDRYGGRGIRMASEWDDFNVFCQWALDSGYQRGLQLDRVDNDGPYSPGNCQWVTQKQNQRNKANNRLLTAFGETKSLAAWAEDPRCQATYAALQMRSYKLGWDDERAITQPLPSRDACKFGHPWTEENTSRTKEGWRRCKACSNQRSQDRRDKVRGLE